MVTEAPGHETRQANVLNSLVVLSENVLFPAIQLLSLVNERGAGHTLTAPGHHHCHCKAGQTGGETRHSRQSASASL